MVYLLPRNQTSSRSNQYRNYYLKKLNFKNRPSLKAKEVQQSFEEDTSFYGWQLKGDNIDGSR